MKNSIIATALNFIVPGSGLWYYGKRSWGVVNFLIATVIVAVLAGHPLAGERIHYVILAVAAGSAGAAHSAASRVRRSQSTPDDRSEPSTHQESTVNEC